MSSVYCKESASFSIYLLFSVHSYQQRLKDKLLYLGD